MGLRGSLFYKESYRPKIRCLFSRILLTSRYFSIIVTQIDNSKYFSTYNFSNMLFSRKKVDYRDVGINKSYYG